MPPKKSENQMVLGRISMLTVQKGNVTIEVSHGDQKSIASVWFDNDAIKMAAALSQYQLCRDALRDNRKVLVEFNAKSAIHPIIGIAAGEHVDELRYIGQRIVDIDSKPFRSADHVLSDQIIKKVNRKTIAKKKATRKTTPKRSGR